MAKKKFIIVSNRLPVTVSKQNGKLVYGQSSGGLASALDRFHKNKKDILWIGWPGICSDDVTDEEKELITQRLKQAGYHPIFLTRKQVKKYYDGYANDTIWPLFHYFQTFVQHDTSYWQAYDDVNDLFAKEVIEHSDKNTTIWVHDYHLMLLPRKIRARIPNSTIGFFLHTPFPSYEIFRLLPNRNDIINGLLGANLVGFHVYDYARHFLKSALRVRGLESANGAILVGKRSVRIDAFPIGIDYKKFAGAEKDTKTAAELKSLDSHYKDKQIILSMDRLDYSKGILRRLKAYEQFLKHYPEYQEKVVLVMIAVPSRVEVSTYKNLKNEIEQTISKINGTYSTVGWNPISYQFRNLPFEQVSALLIRADVALLTPLRDGMNLVAKEYIAAKQNDRQGVLVLSEMTGAIDEMPEAISVNPNDINSMREAIVQALEMPKSLQLRKIKSMQKRLSQYTVNRWAQDFIEQLEKAKRVQELRSNKLIDTSSEQKILRGFKNSKRRLIMLDYDGTIAGLVSSHDPEKSKPPEELLTMLKKISKLP
ncbi:MAG TPA: bifunctional alpha,alpha-trehalose-phosphate synthase (UDP-forming)/trehalose-phosphatase, partial [Patescibacteria group bacterium]|nr:bifunctional alpha,alpha-trehalose-phosphate synthase (UDP-forming)/trehalose-phosphatase [Patescibacteria group bacterium]